MDKNEYDRIADVLRRCSTLAFNRCGEEDLSAISVVLEFVKQEICRALSSDPFCTFSYEQAIKHIQQKSSEHFNSTIEKLLRKTSEKEQEFLIDQVGDHGKDDEEKDDEEKEPPRLRLGGVDADTVKCEGRLHSIALVGKRLYSIDVVRHGPMNIEAAMYTDLKPTFRMFGTNFRKLSRAAFAAANGYIYQRRHEYERRKRAQEKKKENQDGE